MAKFIGLNTGFYLNDVNDLELSLKNLGVNRDDLDHIRGIASAGLTKQMLHLLGNLDLDQEKQQFSLFKSSEYVTGELTALSDTTDGLQSDLRIDHQLRAGAIKYNYVDSLGATKSADISTSRISSWSQIGDGPVFYNADLKINPYDSSTTSYAHSTKSVVKTDNIIFKGEVTPRKFDAEVATHQITMNINGTNRKLYAMKNIPLTFEGFWQLGKLEYKVSPTSVTPAVEFVNENIDPVQRVAVFGSANSSALQTASFESSPADKKLELFYNPSGVIQLKFSSMGLRDLPDAELKNLNLFSAPANLFNEFPDFFKIAGGYINGHSQNLREISMSGNGFSTKDNSLPAHTQLLTRCPASVTKLSINATFSDSTFIDLSSLKTTQSITFNVASVTNNEIVSAGHGLQNDDVVVYEQESNSSISNLTNYGQYYVVNADSDSVKLSASSGGGSLTLTPPSSGFDYKITKLTDSSLTHLYWDAYYSGSPTRTMFDNGETPKVNSNTIKVYHVRNHRYTKLSYSVMSSLKLTHLDVAYCNIDGQKLANGSNQSVLTFPNTNSAGQAGEHPLTKVSLVGNNISVPDFSGKKYLESVTLSELYSYANPPTSTGIEGYFSGCESLGSVYLANSYVKGRINNTFQNLPSLTTLSLGNTRFTGRLSPDTFNGTTSLSYFKITDGNHDFTDSNGVNHILDDAEYNFFANDFQLQTVVPPAGPYGISFQGGYYGGVMKDNSGTLASDTYYLIVADKAYERFLTRYSGAGDASAGGVDGANGWINTTPEAAGGVSYEAAAFADALDINNTDSSINGGQNFTDWYLPSQDELEVIYRNLKPSSDANDITQGNNLNSVPSYNATYTQGNPGQTSSGVFQAGGSQAFNVDTPDEKVLNGTFNSGTSANWSPFSGASTAVTAGQNLSVTQDGDGDAGVYQVIVLPKGTYDFSAAITCEQNVVTGGNFVSGEEYKVVSVGTQRGSVNNVPYANLDFANNEITSNGHPFVTGGRVEFSLDSGQVGSVTGLSANADYYIIKTGTNTFKLATSYANATAATPVVHEFTEDSSPQTHTLTITGADGNNNYIFSGTDSENSYSSSNDPSLKLYTGDTLIIDNRTDPANANYIGSVNHPLQFSSSSGVTVSTSNGISTITATNGTIATINYNCQFHSAMGGLIAVVSRSNNSYDFASNHAFDWNAAGLSGSPTLGALFTAANDGGAINGATATLYDGGADAEQDKAVLTVATGSSPTAGDVLGTGEVLASAGSGPVSGTFAVNASTQIHVRVESHNCNFTIDNVSITNRTGYYWTSTSANNNVDGYAKRFIDGKEILQNKNHVYYVRPVRRVPLVAGTAVEIQGTSATFANCANLATFEIEGKGRNASATSKNIRGKFPNVTFLASISTFKITNTEMTGQIPDFSGAGSLSSLTLSNNKFSGAFTISNAFVDEISIDNNQLSQVANLEAAQLWKFKANNNNIAGIVPRFDNCLNIQEIYLQDNNLIEYLLGSLPDCTSLNSLNLSNNQLSAGSAERLLRDLEQNYENAKRGNVNINLLGNPQISLSELVKNPVLAGIIQKLTTTANWQLSINA